MTIDLGPYAHNYAECLPYKGKALQNATKILAEWKENPEIRRYPSHLQFQKRWEQYLAAKERLVEEKKVKPYYCVKCNRCWKQQRAFDNHDATLRGGKQHAKFNNAGDFCFSSESGSDDGAESGAESAAGDEDAEDGVFVGSSD